MSLTYDTIDKDKITPMMQQYLGQKKQWPDCLLFFRLGDFYEMFFDDAITAARELELALTGRDCGLSERAPMCGVPYHAADNYINRLISRGYKVAICEQVEDPATAKGIVKREVIRVVTPGTITDIASLDEKRNNYIVSIYQLNKYFGFAACDLTTGTFDATQIIIGRTDGKLADEISRYKPAEIVCQQHFADSDLCKKMLFQNNAALTVRPDHYFSLAAVREQPVLTSAQTDCSSSDAIWAQAAAGLLMYLQETQRSSINHIGAIQPYIIQDYMQLDSMARRNLEITETLRDKQRKGSLLWSIDRTRTSMGSRLLRRWLEQPLISWHDIIWRQNAVRLLKDEFMQRSELRDMLQGLYDLERLAGKIALANVNARDLLSLKNTLCKIPAILDLMKGWQDEYLIRLSDELDPLEDLKQLLDEAIDPEAPISLKEGHLIRPGYDKEIDRLRNAAVDGKDWIIQLETRERESTGIKNLKVRYNKVFGFYIEITKSNIDQAPEHYIRRQTLTNAERYITEELKSMEDTILGAEQKSISLEYEVFCRIRQQVADKIFSLQQNAKVLAQLDVLSALAEQADRGQYCQPEISLSDELEIIQGRHPVVEKVIDNGSFVPNDTMLDLHDRRVMILTGPNMAGKSTYMRQVALIVLLAQIGSYVPAQSAKIGLTDRIFTRVGASDDLAGGQSTFMVEMNEVAQILDHATGRSLLILDEIGRGTSTYDGLSIAWAVIEQVSDKQLLGCRTLFATHYHELTDLEGILPGVFNSHVAVDEQNGEIVFLHQIREGGSDQSYGIEVARLAGVPEQVVQRSWEILHQLEAEHGGQQRIRIKKMVKPMDGQLDLFASTMAIRQVDELLDRLSSVDVQQLTPLDALNLLYDLQQEAKKSLRKEK